MKNFKEIAEKCLAGELSGTFKNRQGAGIPSHLLHRFDNAKYPYIYWDNCITIHGNYFHAGKLSGYDIINFIPDNMKEQIKINIPEGKVPVMEQTEKGVVITWKEKELTYSQVYLSIYNNGEAISSVSSTVKNSTNTKFLTKINVLRKLINIRNYFGKHNEYGGFITPPTIDAKGKHKIIFGYSESQIMFKEKEHAEQAIKMLGDELKYLFEPW